MTFITAVLLLRDFKDGKRWLYYPEIWGILTNFIHIKGGKKYFKSIIDSLYNSNKSIYSYNYEKWYSNIKQITNCPYAPQRCENFCPYSDSCNHSKNIITTLKTHKNKITVLSNKINYISKDEARKELYYAVKEAISSNDNNIHIINAQTGIGKTHTYIKCIKESYDNFIIAAPTNKLKDEIYTRLCKEGIKAILERIIYKN